MIGKNKTKNIIPIFKPNLNQNKISLYFPIEQKVKPINIFPIIEETNQVKNLGKETIAQFPNNQTIPKNGKIKPLMNFLCLGTP